MLLQQAVQPKAVAHSSFPLRPAQIFFAPGAHPSRVFCERVGVLISAEELPSLPTLSRQPSSRPPPPVSKFLPPESSHTFPQTPPADLSTATPPVLQTP